MSTARKSNSHSPAKSPVKQDAADPAEESIEVLHLSTDEPAEERKYVDLFEIDGTWYQVWINPPPNVGLKYLRILRRQGEQAGGQFLMETMIGEDGYEALMNYEQLTDDHLTKLAKICEKHAVGSSGGGRGGGKR